jgi:hypothetical protein
MKKNGKYSRNGTAMIIVVSYLLLSAGCSKQVTPMNFDEWRSFSEQLTDRLRLARLDLPTSRLLSSADPTGENDDFNHYIRRGPAGWWVIADLKGPGYISRFWLTGPDADHKIRLIFDNGKNEILTSVEDFLGPRDNRCWHSYAPITYSNQLVVMVEEGGKKDPRGGWPRIFYQINYSTLTSSTKAVVSFPAVWNTATRKEFERGKDIWRSKVSTSTVTSCTNSETKVITCEAVIAGGKQSNLVELTDCGIIEELDVTPDFSGISKVSTKEQLIRSLRLKIYWDKFPEPSVDVPLGTFFGSFYRRTRFSSYFVGMNDDTLWSRFPMPFKQSVVIAIENNAEISIPVKIRLSYHKLSEWDSKYGYLHAKFSRSNERETGKPHTILKVRGNGKYAGCFLAVGSLDRSWWALEGDEMMWIDGERIPSWQGTGLEDYFNSGWYYANPRVYPLSGLLFKVPFRTIQYRFHLNDAVRFSSSFEMIFERGPRNASHAWMESVAFYYMETPVSASGEVSQNMTSGIVHDEFEQYTIMTELIDRERGGDIKGAYERLLEFMENYPQHQDISLLSLRGISYQRYLCEGTNLQEVYKQFIATCKDDRAVQQAKLLLWYDENPEHGLMGVYCNARSKIFLDGNHIVEVDHPQRMIVLPVRLKPGKHVIGIEAKWVRPGAWAQVWLMANKQLIVSDGSWRRSEISVSGWNGLDFDDSSWQVVGSTSDSCGPPEAPYVYLEPNAFPLVQSKAVGLYIADNKTYYFRKVFEISP